MCQKHQIGKASNFCQINFFISDGNTVWVEWRWSGLRADGQPFAMNGVTIQHVTDRGIDAVRFFMEPLDTSGQRVGDAVRRATAS